MDIDHHMTWHQTCYLEGVDKSYCITWYALSKFQLAPGTQTYFFLNKNISASCEGKMC